VAQLGFLTPAAGNYNEHPNTNDELLKNHNFFVEFTVICLNNLKIVQSRKSIFLFNIFVLLPILPPLGLCHPGRQ
jgi:hypothetical protein